MVWTVFVYSPFHFIRLTKVFLYLLVSLPFSYTSALRTYIGTLISLNIFKSNNKVFIVTLFQSQNAFFLESLHLFLTQRTHLLHIIFKFTLQSWQVPRSSVGRALYRESGPSQDGDPVPGNLPFFLFFFSIFLNPFCDLFLPFFVLQPVYKHSGEAFYIVFSLQYMSRGFLPLGKFTPFLLVLFCAMCLSSLHIKRETEWGDKRKKGKANLVVILICSNSNNCIYIFLVKGRKHQFAILWDTSIALVEGKSRNVAFSHGVYTKI